jgi:hypothetical protein
MTSGSHIPAISVKFSPAFVCEGVHVQHIVLVVRFAIGRSKESPVSIPSKLLFNVPH